MLAASVRALRPTVFTASLNEEPVDFLRLFTERDAVVSDLFVVG